MTTQESFKRRVRARMSKTGERYNAARRALLAKSTAGPRAWASEPETSDAKVAEATGRGWNAWCDLIDAWPGHAEGHTAVAAWLVEQHGVDGWWAQSVTVGWERITGRRLPYQMADGTFSASKSRTVEVDAEALRTLLLDDADRADLFGGTAAALRSRPTSKNIRLAVGGGTVEISIEPKGADHAKVTVAHTKLAAHDDVQRWKHFWTDWLAALNEG